MYPVVIAVYLHSQTQQHSENSIGGLRNGVIREREAGITRKRCAAECAVRFEPMRANTGFFATSTKCFRDGITTSAPHRTE
jgi:hypothetical protein